MTNTTGTTTGTAELWCLACLGRRNGHGHFGWYCEPCAELPQGRAADLAGECDGCDTTHPACFDHDGTFGEGPIFAVPCPADGLTTFVTRDGLVTA